MANCFYHPEVEATLRCAACGKPLCNECVIPREERHLCARCVRLRDRRQQRTEARKEGPTWLGLLVPGLAQLLRGQMYKGSFLLAYFLVATAADSPFFVPLAYVLSIWDYFSPLIEEESKSTRQVDFQWFLGILLIIIGVLALALGQLGRYLSASGAEMVLSAATVALGVFLAWYHSIKPHKEEEQ